VAPYRDAQGALPCSLGPLADLRQVERHRNARAQAQTRVVAAAWDACAGGQCLQLCDDVQEGPLRLVRDLERPGHVSLLPLMIT
jgi:hypothetical protein